MRILITGADGQLGSALRRILEHEVVAACRSVLDITSPEMVERVLTQNRPQVVINTAAYNQVDRAEEEPATAYAVNALGARNLAQWCGQHDVLLVHVSTDYVFGLDRERNRPYSPNDAPGPLSAYGTSKLAGEYFVRSLCPRHFVVRTCGLYGRAENPARGNFVETMLRLADERDELTVVADQRCTPTSAAHLARVIAGLLECDAYGLYHATNAGSTSWYEFACAIFELAESEIRVRPITSAEYAAAAKRPHYSVLDCDELWSTLGWSLPDWREALAEYLKQRDWNQRDAR